MVDQWTRQQWEIENAMARESHRLWLVNAKREALKAINHGHDFTLNACDCGLSRQAYSLSKKDSLDRCPNYIGPASLGQLPSAVCQNRISRMNSGRTI